MGLHGPALISTCCHSALAARAATGAPTVTAVTLCVVREYSCVPFRATGLELDRAEVIETLLTLQGVFLYARIFLAPTQSLAKVRTSLCAVRTSRMNDLAVTVSIPCVQQAETENHYESSRYPARYVECSLHTSVRVSESDIRGW